MVATSTAPDRKFLQGITPVEDMRELFLVQNPRYKKRHTFLSLKSLTKTCLGFPLYTRRSGFETLILNRLELCLG